MESSKERRLYERQKQEMEAIENELANVRTQYHKICRERGTAHLTAQLVQKQEEEMLEFESRRDRIVRARAEKVAREKEKEIKTKSLKEEAKRKELIERRKDIFNRDWNPDTESTSVKKVQDRVTKRQEIESQLRKLAEMEKSLEEKIREKKNQRPYDKTKKEVPIYNSSSASSLDDSEEVDPHFVGRYVRSSQPHSHHHHHHHHHGNKPGTCLERRNDSGYLETDLITDPDVIAKNVLFKLERMKDQMRKTIEAVVVSNKIQVFRDTAINTTKPRDIVSGAGSSVAGEEHPSGASSSSSYKSLPEIVQPKKREFTTLLQKLKEQCLNDRQVEGDFTSPGSSDSDDFSQRVQSLVESSEIQRYMDHNDRMQFWNEDHNDRMQFWNEVCQEAGTILHEETAVALANMTDHSKKVPSSDVSKIISIIEEVDLASGSESPRLDSKPGHSTQEKLTSQHSSPNTVKGILEERSLTFASSFSSDEE